MKIAITEQNGSVATAKWVDDVYEALGNESILNPENLYFVLSAIKMEAQRRVIAISGATGDIKDASAWVPKQLNPIAAFCLLLYKMQKGVATAEDETKALSLIAVWTKVYNIRLYSDQLEQAFAVDKQEVNILTGWPE